MLPWNYSKGETLTLEEALKEIEARAYVARIETIAHYVLASDAEKQDNSDLRDPEIAKKILHVDPKSAREAREYYEKLGDINSLWKAAEIAERTGDYDSAIRILEAAIPGDSLLQIPHYAARICFEQKRLPDLERIREKAEKVYQEWLPTDTLSGDAVGHYSRAAGNFREIKEWCNTLKGRNT
jgi:hypothetical protein